MSDRKEVGAMAPDIRMKTASTTLRPPPVAVAWTMWGLGALFYFIGFFQRVAPAVIADELMADFGLTATTLGNLSAFYFYSYVAMQIPTGLLADHFGVRRLFTWGSIVAGFGSLLFALAPSIFYANLGRLLVGGAVAVSFVGLLKLAMHWMAPHQYALSSGMALLVGVAGAIVAGVPLQFLTAAYGWRSVMGTSGVLLFGVGAVIWWLVRDDPLERGFASYAPADTVNHATSVRGALQGIGQVLNYRNTWLLALAPGGLAGPVLTFAGLWGVSFLTSQYGLPQARAAALCTTLLISMAVSGPVMGALSDKIGRRKPLYVGGALLAVIGWTILIWFPGLSQALLVILLVIIGIGSGGMVIGFAFARESVPGRLGGTVSGVINTGVMLGPMLLQPGVGVMLDWQWQGEMLNGARLYTLSGYQIGFSLMLAWSVLALLLPLFTRETRCRPLAENQNH
jgi:MFS family permease